MIKKGRQPKSLKEHMPHCFFGWLAFLNHLYNREPGTGYQCTGKGKGKGSGGL